MICCGQESGCTDEDVNRPGLSARQVVRFSFGYPDIYVQSSLALRLSNTAVLSHPLASSPYAQGTL